MGAQGQLTQGAILRNPRTKYKRSKNVFAVTSIALIIGRDWPRLVQPLAQSLIGSPGTLAWRMRVEFLLRTDSGYPRDVEVTLLTLANMSIPSALTPIGQLHQSPPSPIPGDLGTCPSHQSHATPT